MCKTRNVACTLYTLRTKFKYIIVTYMLNEYQASNKLTQLVYISASHKISIFRMNHSKILNMRSPNIIYCKKLNTLQILKISFFNYK